MDRIPGAAGLYIGDYSSSLDHKTLQRVHVTHVLSALNPPLELNSYVPFKHLVVGLDDLEQEDAIQHFPRSNAFIQEGLEGRGGRGVLVHCANGRSRSATLLIAFLLHQNPALNPTDALALVRKGRPEAEPNPGFMSQLALYHTMGCPSAPANHPIYQHWLYQRHLEANLSTGLAPSTIHFSDDSDDPSSPLFSNLPITGSNKPLSSSSSSAPPLSQSQSQSTIRCRRCRTPLATSIYLVPHDPPPSASASASTSASSSSSFGAKIPPPCAHFFLQPLSWMRSELEQGKLEGRLECPKRTCRANVGKYAWQGMRCSCGVWMVPGISVAKGRVDEIGGR